MDWYKYFLNFISSIDWTSTFTLIVVIIALYALSKRATNFVIKSRESKIAPTTRTDKAQIESAVAELQRETFNKKDLIKLDALPRDPWMDGHPVSEEEVECFRIEFRNLEQVFADSPASLSWLYYGGLRHCRGEWLRKQAEIAGRLLTLEAVLLSTDEIGRELLASEVREIFNTLVSQNDS